MAVVRQPPVYHDRDKVSRLDQAQPRAGIDSANAVFIDLVAELAVENQRRPERKRVLRARVDLVEHGFVLDVVDAHGEILRQRHHRGLRHRAEDAPVAHHHAAVVVGMQQVVARHAQHRAVAARHIAGVLRIPAVEPCGAKAGAVRIDAALVDMRNIIRKRRVALLISVNLDGERVAAIFVNSIFIVKHHDLFGVACLAEMRGKGVFRGRRLRRRCGRGRRGLGRRGRWRCRKRRFHCGCLRAERLIQHPRARQQEQRSRREAEDDEPAFLLFFLARSRNNTSNQRDNAD